MMLLYLLAGAAEGAPPMYTFTLSSDPSGAMVIDRMGNEVCRTPCDLQFPQYAFRGPRLISDRYVGSEIGYVVSKDGYAPETIFITQGPFPFVNLNGTHLFNYYVIPSREAFVRLPPANVSVGSPAAAQAPCAGGFGRAADGNCYPLAISPVSPAPPDAPPNKGWLGVSLIYIQGRGVVVVSVVPSSPAERAGIKGGMLVSAFDGAPVTSVEQLTEDIARVVPGRQVQLVVTTSDGNEATLSATIEAWK